MFTEATARSLPPSSTRDFLSGEFVPLSSEATLHLLPESGSSKIGKRAVQHEGIVRIFGMNTPVYVTLHRGFLNQALSRLGLDVLPTPAVIEPKD